jgi:hypothetical protein
MATLLKQSVHGDLSREMWHAHRKLERLWARKYKQEIVVTSRRDGTHGDGSLHPQGEAEDVRPPRGGYDPGQVLMDIVDTIGPRYDVIFEGTHFHIEHDPK